MKFCSSCSSPLISAIPTGDDRLRHICKRCGAIHYQIPKLIAGCIPVWSGKVLLCKRAIEPKLGFWTLPAGFMELGETVSEAACREAMEEANVDVQIGPISSMISLPAFSQVHVFFHATMHRGVFSPGLESLEVKLFEEKDIPWDEIAFETVKRTLRYYFADRLSGNFIFRQEDLTYPEG